MKWAVLLLLVQVGCHGVMPLAQPPADTGLADTGRDAAPADGARHDRRPGVGPDSELLDAAWSDADRPDAAQPDAAQPDAARPDAAQPDMARPDAAQPDAAQPDAAQPDMARPDAAQPDALVKPPLILATADNTLHVFETNGTSAKAAIPIPDGPSAPGETARDLVGLAGGKAAVYNGTFGPDLSVHDPGARTGKIWTHHGFAGWSTTSNVSYGGLATWGSYIYATDMATGTDTTAGLVRFDTGSWTAVRYGTKGFIDVNLGLDGKLYALVSDSKTVEVFDPQTMAPLGKITLPLLDARAIAVNKTGELFVAAWSGGIHHLQGATTVKTLATPANNLTDIDLGFGVLAASSRFGEVVVTTEAFAPPKAFVVGSGKPTFIGLVPNP